MKYLECIRIDRPSAAASPPLVARGSQYTTSWGTQPSGCRSPKRREVHIEEELQAEVILPLALRAATPRSSTTRGCRPVRGRGRLPAPLFTVTACQQTLRHPSVRTLTKRPDNRSDSPGIHRRLLSWTGHDPEGREERRTRRMTVVFSGTRSSKGDTR